jgi:DNA-binding MarR family transcriptional regulator
MKTVLEALQDTDKIYRAAIVKMTKAQGITTAEWSLLQHVSDGFDSQEKLAKETNLDTSTLSRQLGSLHKKELVSTVAVGQDRRKLIYELTEAGEAVLMAVNSAHGVFTERVFKVWSPEEQSMMQILLNRLEKSLSKEI